MTASEGSHGAVAGGQGACYPSRMSAPGASRARILLAYIACFVTWGSTWAVVKLALEDLPPLLFAGARMLLAGLVLLPFARIHRSGLGARTLGLLTCVGLLQIGVSYGMMNVAQQWIPSSWSALLFSTFPVWLLLVGRLLLADQPLTAPKLLSAALGLAGIVALQHEHLSSLSFSGRVVAGCLLTVVAAMLVAIANVLVRRSLSHVPPRINVCVQTLTSSVLLLAVAAVVEADRPVHWTPRAVGAVVYLALCATVVTYMLLYWLLPRVPLSAVGAMPLLDTLVAVLLGVVLLNEPVTLSLVAGGALILGGAAIANLLPAPAPPAEEAAAPARPAAG
ncbi:DMT family transporter [Myxococcaceae bacterium GXIMD 01537]